jgi:hypothetical protein
MLLGRGIDTQPGVALVSRLLSSEAYDPVELVEMARRVGRIVGGIGSSRAVRVDDGVQEAVA